jgi:phenylpyruvate tautomerase
MPLLKLETSVNLSEHKRNALLLSLSKIVAETIGKPEQYVMVSATPASMVMSGIPGDAAFVDLRSIGGLNESVNRKLSQQICHLLSQSLGISAIRIYISFSDIQPGDWGWNGQTFG